jgi:hypothetical protein
MKMIVICLISAMFLGQGNAQSKSSVTVTLKPQQTAALQKAITDEIYDYEYEEGYFPEGGPVGHLVSESDTRVPLYINPTIKDGQGEIIYKLMPYGEIFRIFHLRADGLVLLDGDPQIGFPASQPDRKTVYMDDAELALMRAKWIHASFEVLLDPPQETIQNAVSRQKLRNDGFSAWESTHSVKSK